jgi:3-methyladenine DNA glycosylase/8-oxoguanine DNA glycosylase
LRLPHGAGVAEVAERAGRGGWLDCRLHLEDLRDLTTATQRMRRLFDLDADPYAVAERLGADPVLGAAVAARPGLRAPGAADPEEFALRAVLGEGAGEAVAAYGTRLPAAGGTLTHLFPRAAELAAAEVPSPVRAVAAALAAGLVRLDPGVDRAEAERGLLALPGVSPEVAALIRMRALGDPDVLLAEGAPPQSPAWRPWRTYASHYLSVTRRGAGVPLAPGAR